MGKTFQAKSTTDEVLEGIDLRGKRALVTGVSAGLGVETARTLAAHGAEVVGAARNLAKAERATEIVRADAKNGGGFSLVELDLNSLASVRRCADALVADGRPFDLVIANAGVMMTPFGRTEDGFELQIGANHFGHFVLVNRIAGLMRRGARLVNLSSSGHHISDVDLDDLNFERRPYQPGVSYGQSKTANILFAVEFDRRWKDRGVRATAVHPGTIQTELGRHLDEASTKIMLGISEETGGKIAPHVKTVAEGASTTVWAGVYAPAEEIGGRYCEDCHVGQPVEKGGLFYGVAPYAIDPERAKALWAKSEALVGETYPA
jgi:NAD(P)-dependent dehydrogenase (short-subunit alcohol dehydrogenase family)